MEGYVWQGYHDLLENYARMQMARADRYQKLNFAIAGLSYDLAVLQANYAIDRDLRGEEAMRAFQDEGADLLKEVTAAWRTSGERLDLSFEDDPEAVKDFAQPFHRVRDDLRRLLHDLPPTPPTQPGASTESREPEHAREAFVLPILNRKGWSLLDWANTSEVDFHTVNDYLKGATKPYPSTRVKLAASLGVAVEDLPK